MTPKSRYINTTIWDDSWFIELSEIEKLLFLYLLTNPKCNIAGVYEVSVKRISFDTGISIEKVLKAFQRFEKDGKIMFDYDENIIFLRNFVKHQKLNPNIQIGILDCFNNLKDSTIILFFNELVKPFKDFQELVKALNYINLNLNLNLNRNRNVNGEVSKTETIVEADALPKNGKTKKLPDTYEEGLEVFKDWAEKKIKGFTNQPDYQIDIDKISLEYEACYKWMRDNPKKYKGNWDERMRRWVTDSLKEKITCFKKWESDKDKTSSTTEKVSPEREAELREVYGVIVNHRYD